MLHALSGDETPLRWANHLLSRYDQIRHPEAGLAGTSLITATPAGSESRSNRRLASGQMSTK